MCWSHCIELVAMVGLHDSAKRLTDGYYVSLSAPASPEPYYVRTDMTTYSSSIVTEELPITVSIKDLKLKMKRNQF